MRFPRIVPFLLLLLLLTACHAPERQQEQVFNLNLSSGSLESLDPAYAKDLYTMWTTHMIYNTLVETDSNLYLRPSVAHAWDISSDGLTYVFHLRQDVYFQDNPLFNGKRKMLASDVVYSFRRIIDPAVASSGAWIFNGHVSGAEAFTAPDDSTFVMKLVAPFRPMLAMLSMPYCSVVPHEVVNRYGKDFRSHPCGTGPFQFALWDEGNMLLLHRNGSYWELDGKGKQLPYLDALQITFYDSKATEFLLFLQGKLHFTHGLDGSFKDLVLRKDGVLKPEFSRRFHLKKGRYLNTEYLGFLTDSSLPQVRNSPLRFRKVRQAINYAIDRGKISTYFKNGIGIPATGGFTPPGLAGFDTVAHYGYHYDPEKAAALLSEAGFPDGKGLKELTILTPENYVDIVNFVASELKAVGIPAKIEVMQPNILKQQMSRSQAVFFRAQWIADYPDAETYLAFFNSRFPAPPNYTRYHNAAYDLLYEQSMNLPDSLRFRAYRAMDSMAISDAPLVPLFYDQYLHFTQNNVHGFAENPMNLIDLKQVYLK
ncbi:ABC transporter substrate-binding protein [Rurimicrobium arvi]|uniref:ABC transporter substrate-binding protein n=1 Tax=Rurimicrobium arvi TaxID=2049916 RepID=A0ABP8MP57_9BACT